MVKWFVRSHAENTNHAGRKVFCKHHVCHVKSSQSGTEYWVRNMKKEGGCYDESRKGS